MSGLKNTLKNNKWACWLALACLVVPMFASYFFDDMFSDGIWRTMDSTPADTLSYASGVV